MNSPARDLPELPKSSKRHSADNSLTAESPYGDSCTKPRNSRRHQSKDSSEGCGRSRDSCTKPRSSRRHQRKDSSEGGSTSSRLSQDQSNGDLESPPSSTSKKTPGIPKKSRRKKSRDYSMDGSKASIPPPTYTSPFSDPGPETNSNILESTKDEPFQTSGG